MARITNQERDRRRMITDRAAVLADLSEEYEEAKGNALAVGDRAEVRRLATEFAPKRRDHRLEDERLEMRGESLVMLGTNMWYTWGRIALEHEETARHASHELLVAHSAGTNISPWLGVSFRSSLVATTSSAFALEGLYGAVCYLTAQGTARVRWRLVVEALDALFELDTVPDVSARVERMFDVRDQGVHAWAAIRVPAKHGDIVDMGVQYEVALFSHAEATASIDLLAELLVACVGHPRNRRAQRWSEQNGDAVDRFAMARQSGNRNDL